MARHPGYRRQILAGNLRLLRRSPMLLLIGSVLTLCLVAICALTWVTLTQRPTDQGFEISAELPAPRDSLPPTDSSTGLPWSSAQVVRVVDGDTLIVAIQDTQARLRLIGMDTPETVHPTKPVQCFGAEATARTQTILNSYTNRVWLEKDVSETDRYGRLLRYVWLGPTPDSPMLNEQLVAEGYAQVSTFPPDVKYQDRFLVAQRAARAANLGLWGRCGGFGLPLAPPDPTAPPRSQ
jgi:micrococcal nuclease